MSHRPVAVSAAELMTSSSDEQTHPPPPAYELVPPTMPTEITGDNRPSLPVRARNLFLNQGGECVRLWMRVHSADPAAVSPTVNDPDALVVKFQTIVRDGKEIIVGRLKVPTVRISSHPPKDSS